MIGGDFIESFDGALEPAFCQHLIDRFEASPHRTRGQTGSGIDESKKISTDLYLNDHAEWQADLEQVQIATAHCLERYFARYFFALIGPLGLTVRHPQTGEPTALTQDNFEAVGAPQIGILMRQLFRLGRIQMQKYDAGRGNYRYWHSEVFPEQHGGGSDTLHRMLLFMFYLNDIAEGGETDFYYQARSVQPRGGRCLIAPAYFTHTHRGRTPISGDKYILTSWVLFQRAEQLYGPR